MSSGLVVMLLYCGDTNLSAKKSSVAVRESSAGYLWWGQILRSQMIWRDLRGAAHSQVIDSSWQLSSHSFWARTSFLPSAEQLAGAQSLHTCTRGGRKAWGLLSSDRHRMLEEQQNCRVPLGWFPTDVNRVASTVWANGGGTEAYL